MFGRGKQAATNTHLKAVEVLLISDEGSFSGDDDTEIKIRGFDLQSGDGAPIRCTDSGPACPGAFHFRLAGATHHPGVKVLDGDKLSPVLVRHQPDNPHDRNALEVVSQKSGQVVGFVSATLAPAMLPYLTRTTKGTGSNGVALKTFHKGRAVVGAELLIVANGYQLSARSA
ncbi:MAG: HIRAN domain-containing protein [Acidimicrobiales bacterium]